MERWRVRFDNGQIVCGDRVVATMRATCVTGEWEADARYIEAALNAGAPASAVEAAPESSEGGGGGAPAAGEVEALERIRAIADDPEVDDGDETEVLWKAITTIHQIADDALALRAPAPPTPPPHES